MPLFLYVHSISGKEYYCYYFNKIRKKLDRKYKHIKIESIQNKQIKTENEQETRQQKSK